MPFDFESNSLTAGGRVLKFYLVLVPCGVVTLLETGFATFLLSLLSKIQLPSLSGMGQYRDPNENLYVHYVVAAVFLFGFFWVVNLAYLAPSFVAAQKKNSYFGAILVFNVLIGWTLIAWVVLLIIAFQKFDRPPQRND